MNTEDQQTPCCPEFDPSTYEGKEINWKDKLFLQDSVKQIMHFPLNMPKVIARMWKKVQEAEAAPKDKDFLLLAYDPSPWKSELYMTVTKEVPEATTTRLSGTYLTRVFDGPYGTEPKWLKEMEEYVAKKGKKLVKPYFHYTYCPKCAKKYGHNYVVVFAQV